MAWRVAWLKGILKIPGWKALGSDSSGLGWVGHVKNGVFGSVEQRYSGVFNRGKRRGVRLTGNVVTLGVVRP